MLKLHYPFHCLCVSVCVLCRCVCLCVNLFVINKLTLLLLFFTDGGAFAWSTGDF